MLKKIFSALSSAMLVLGICPCIALAETGNVATDNAEVVAEITASDDDMSSISAELPMDVSSSASSLAASDSDSGTIGTCTWAIDAGGCLTIAPEDGVSGEFGLSSPSSNSWPWSGNSTSIKSVKVKAGTSVSGSLSYMFNACSKLTSLDLSGLDTSNVTSTANMFRSCTSLATLDLSDLKTPYVTDMKSMFYSCSKLTSLDLSGLDTSNVTDMSYMFYGCSSLTSLDVTSFDTSNVSNMNNMFYNCTSLTSLDVTSFDTAHAADMLGLFHNCASLTSLDVSNFDTSHTPDMGYMFDGCTSLTSLDVSNFDTSHATSLVCMFRNCASLVSLDLSNFDTSNVVDMASMFYDCTSLTSLDVTSFDTANVRSINKMFYDCTSLISLDMSSFDTRYVTTMNDIFYNCTGLRSVAVGENFTLANYLPTPIKDNKNGKWLSDDGTVYDDPSELPNYVAAKYVAIFQTPNGSWSPGFYDVCLPKEWYFDSVYYIADLGLIVGYAPDYTIFGVGDSLTRAQLAVILWRYCEPEAADGYNASATKNATGMSDVANYEYYTGAANWAVSNQIINGFENADGTRSFEPDTAVSFEQMLTILANLAADGANQTWSTSALSRFADGATVDTWAAPSVAWCADKGFFSGYENADGTRTIEPFEDVARERCATVLANAIQGGLM